MGICQQPQNPIRPDPVLRALLLDLDDWVSTGREPPTNRVPRRSDEHSGSVAAAIGQGFPEHPGVTYNGIHAHRRSVGFRAEFRRRHPDGAAAQRRSARPTGSLSRRRMPTATTSPASAYPMSRCRLATYTGWACVPTPDGDTAKRQADRRVRRHRPNASPSPPQRRPGWRSAIRACRCRSARQATGTTPTMSRR